MYPIYPRDLKRKEAQARCHHWRFILQDVRTCLPIEINRKIPIGLVWLQYLKEGGHNIFDHNSKYVVEFSLFTVESIVTGTHQAGNKSTDFGSKASFTIHYSLFWDWDKLLSSFLYVLLFYATETNPMECVNQWNR